MRSETCWAVQCYLTKNVERADAYGWKYKNSYPVFFLAYNPSERSVPRTLPPTPIHNGLQLTALWACGVYGQPKG